MKFTGVYATYYQDICKQFDKVVAKRKNLERSKPELNMSSSNAIKSFNKRVDDFNGTTLVSYRETRVNGVTIYTDGTSETILQIQCIISLRNACFVSMERYYAQSDYCDVKSWDDFDALFKEIEKEYDFIQTMLKLYITERKKINANALGAINVSADLQNAFKYTKRICTEQAGISRRRSLPEFKRYSELAVKNCLEWFAKGSHMINYRPLRL